MNINDKARVSPAIHQLGIHSDRAEITASQTHDPAFVMSMMEFYTTS